MADVTIPDIQSFFSMLDKHPDEVIRENAYERYCNALRDANCTYTSFELIKAEVLAYADQIGYPRLRKMYEEIVESHFPRVVMFHGTEAVANILAPYGFQKIDVDGRVQIGMRFEVPLAKDGKLRFRIVIGMNSLWGVDPQFGAFVTYCGEPIDEFIRTIFEEEKKSLRMQIKSSTQDILDAEDKVKIAIRRRDILTRQLNAISEHAKHA